MWFDHCSFESKITPSTFMVFDDCIRVPYIIYKKVPKIALPMPVCPECKQMQPTLVDDNRKIKMLRWVQKEQQLVPQQQGTARPQARPQYLS